MIMSYCSISNTEYKKVLDYVKTSDLFYKKKKEYALRVVEWQIQFIKNDRPGYRLNKEHGDDFWRLGVNCDKSFRWTVIDTLEAIGMNRMIIEEGLEKYSDEWRDILISQAFINRYVPVFYNFGDTKDSKKLPKVDEEFKKAWIALRKYEYYKEHRQSVDLFGQIESDMQMSTKEYSELKEFVKNESSKRDSEIEETNPKYTDYDSLANTPVVIEQKEEQKGFIKRFKSKFKHKDK